MATRLVNRVPFVRSASFFSPSLLSDVVSRCVASRCSMVYRFTLIFELFQPINPLCYRWNVVLRSRYKTQVHFQVLVYFYSFFFSQSVGCDGVVGSGVTMDACGVCGGQGKGCRLYEGIFMEPILPRGHQHVTTIPKGAMSLNISELRFSSNFLGISWKNTLETAFI